MSEIGYWYGFCHSGIHITEKLSQLNAVGCREGAVEIPPPVFIFTFHPVIEGRLSLGL